MNPALVAAAPPQPVASPMTAANKEIPSVSTPNPTASAPSAALVAASPFLKQALTNLKGAVTTTLTGDPMQIPLRAGPAFAIFLNQLALLEPSLASAEVGAVNQDIGSKIDGLIAKLP